MEPPSADRGLQEGDEQKMRNNTIDRVEKNPSQCNKNKNYNEVELGNSSDRQEFKNQKLELQGEFHKIKPLMFDGEAEEVAEA